ncbi:hypothetical protein QYE76_061506 [Lolium multiflorum]|uniref:Uncharacterized protein n=1 Tax=Lolium multiflorum TaxID=4521 RepID=A0AAD8S0U8_LOLMU|nr:hypothetical protein QYE76_061506 [Lolium multiflorum]
MSVRIARLAVALLSLLIMIIPATSSVVSGQTTSFIIVVASPALVISTHILVEEVIERGRWSGLSSVAAKCTNRKPILRDCEKYLTRSSSDAEIMPSCAKYRLTCSMELEPSDPLNFVKSGSDIWVVAGSLRSLGYGLV